MRIKSIVAGAAFAFALAVGAAAAAERFATLDGVAVGSMSAAELSAVRGHGIIVQELPWERPAEFHMNEVTIDFRGDVLDITPPSIAAIDPGVDIVVGSGP